MGDGCVCARTSGVYVCRVYSARDETLCVWCAGLALEPESATLLEGRAAAERVAAEEEAAAAGDEGDAMGGLGKVYQLFGDRLPKILDELNERLAA